uniref:HALC4_136 n=1 Tax=synthetic construct TaxID=32630 RepID=UPI0021C4C991|nr:Chain A, HALC4_136 [synthetic construct]8D09_B Chain B, HALC4_136 [synthetic construct]
MSGMSPYKKAIEITKRLLELLLSNPELAKKNLGGIATLISLLALISALDGTLDEKDIEPYIKKLEESLGS